jgi:outer membrane protein OmpA-like peptidoglycan-associated protein
VRLSRSATLAFSVTLGIAALRCTNPGPPATSSGWRPRPAQTADASAEADAVPDVDAAAEEQHRTMIPIYGEPTPRIVEVVFFDPGSDVLDADDRTTLAAVAEVLEHHAFSIEIEGHMDPSEKGKKLSERRAERVRKVLVDLGVEPERLRVKDHGGTRPLSATPSNKNARVAFRILEADAG